MLTPHFRTLLTIAMAADVGMIVSGFSMFRYPMTWARMNARFSRDKFDSAKQLTSIKRFGLVFLIAGAFSLVSMLYLAESLFLMKRD
jgi:uncharacterized protein YjeT (DUF2065 family)